MSETNLILSNIYKLATIFPEAYLEAVGKQASAPTHYGFHEIKTHLFKNSKKYKDLRNYVLNSPNIALEDHSGLKKLGEEFKKEAQKLVEDLNILKGVKVDSAVESLMSDLFKMAIEKAKNLQRAEEAKNSLEEEAKKIFKESMLKMDLGLKNYFLDRAHAFKKANSNDYANYLWELSEKF